MILMMIHATAAESVMRSASVHEFQEGDGRGSILRVGWGTERRGRPRRDLRRRGTSLKIPRRQKCSEVRAYMT